MENAVSAGPEWAQRFFAVTLFVDDLVRERQWYTDVFGMPVVDESPENVVFKFPGPVFINLNAHSASQLHLAPGKVAPVGAPSRFMLTVLVDDVDAAAQRLTEQGVTLLTGPIDRPWGSRTVSFADPSGNFWELSA